jgi:UDPglucose 6-dehydrogenase
MKISIIGLGFVGGAMLKSFDIKNSETNSKYLIYGYDKYKNGGIGDFDTCLNSDIIFLALPTEYDYSLKEYDKQPLYSVLDELQYNNYIGVIVIKSTIEPTMTEEMQKKYKKIHFVHNPEFLTARTAFADFHNQQHIVLGKSSLCSDDKVEHLISFYKNLYPDSEISLCTSIESESMKIFCNSFYAVKIQFCNELYLLSQKIGGDYNNIINLMIKNNWINPMHTNIPGPDGKLSYGGLCFPKDTNALLQVMKKNNSEHKLLEACIEERNEMRDDHDNIKNHNNTNIKNGV